MHNDVKLSLTAIKQALYMEEFDGLTAQAKMKPVPRVEQRPAELAGQPRQGAVLLLLYEKADQLYIVLTRRRDDLRSHAGQVSFPGGRREASETLQEAALRETFEEVGVDPRQTAILGKLTPLYIPPSDFEVHPFVGWHEQAPRFRPQPAEVAEIIEVPLSSLLEAKVRDEEIWERRGILLQVPFFRLEGHKVWGATAMMLSEFVERLLALVEKQLADN